MIIFCISEKFLFKINYMLIIIFFFFYIVNSTFYYKLKIKIINIKFVKKNDNEISRIKIFTFLKNLNFFLIKNVKFFAIIFYISFFIFCDINNIHFIRDIFFRIKRILLNFFYNFFYNNYQRIFYIFKINRIIF